MSQEATQIIEPTALVTATDEQRDAILAALRHLQQAIVRKDDLTHLNDIADLKAVDAEAIDQLCADVNPANPEEHYRMVAMSTGHLTEADRDALAAAVAEGDQMVMRRDAGFFIKLFEEEGPSNFRHGHSDRIKDIIRWAHQSGYRMIEFDCDAVALPQFPFYDW